MTDELQQARADVLNPANLIGYAAAGYELLILVDPARVDHLIEVATREYREALADIRLSTTILTGDVFNRGARTVIPNTGETVQQRAARALLPQPVPTQEVD